MRARVFVGIGVVVAIVVALLGWRSCGDTSTGRSNAAGGGTTAHGGAGAATARGKRTGPVAPASLAGRVTREGDGAGIAGAIVSLAPAELMAMFIKADSPTLVVVTDATGAWTAPAVPPGAYVVAATARGYLPGSREKLVIGSGERKTGIDLALTAGGTIVRGTVSDVGGGPIADARITATVDRDMPELWGRADLVTTTGPDGRYELTLRDGEYSLAATHDDYTEESEHAEVAGSELTIDFTLVPGAVIRGQVIARDSNEPVPGALVRAETDGARRGGDATAVADASGNFTLRGLTAGTIELESMGRGYASTAPTEVAVGIGEQLDGVRVIVDRAYSISGRVVRVGKPDQGLPGVTLGAFSIAAKAFGLALEPSAQDGSFEIVGVKPASYMLFAVGEGSVPDIGKNVEVVDKDVEGVIVELPAGATLTGRVEPATAGVHIGISPAGEIGLANMFEVAKSFLVRGETDAAGTFTLKSVPAGAFELSAMATDGHAGSLAIVVGDADQTNLVVTLASRGSVAGRVVDTAGKPVARMRVSANRLDADPERMKISFGRDGRSQSTNTATDGSFKLVGLEAGKYRVQARGDDEAWIMDERKKAQPSKAAVELDITATTVKTGVTLTVEARDGVIRGVVVLPDGKPAADAWVTANRSVELPKGVPASAARYLGGAGPPVLTNADGQFTIGKLRRGTYKLVVEGPRGATRAEKLDVKTGDSVTIQLLSRGTLTGKVTAAGAPVPKYEIACDGPAGDRERIVDAADGAYTLERLAPGPYTCTVDSDAGTATSKIDVPAGAATLDFALTRWASITGVVVRVLDKKPVTGVHVFAGPGDDHAWSSRNVEQLMMGSAPKTDAAGRFSILRVAPGKGKVAVMPKEGFQPLGTREYTATEAQRVDIGTIEVVPPRTGDAGTFGFATAIDDDKKLVVAYVKEGGPAATAAMQVGDRVVSINGRDVAALTPEIAQTLLASGTVGVGQQVQLALDRAGTPVTMTLVSVKW